MKTKINIWRVASMLIICLLSTIQLKAQEWDILLIREDHVKPSLTTDYENALADLKYILTDEAYQGTSYYSHLQDNYIYSHIIPISNPEMLENQKLDNIIADIGNSLLYLVEDDLNACLEKTRYYAVHQENELCYAPPGELGFNKAPYRKWNYYYLYPGSGELMEDLFADWKSLYMENDLPGGFNIFSVIIGTDLPLLIVSSWAEDPEAYQSQLSANSEILGDQGYELWSNMMQYIRKVETLEGWFLPQYSYIPEIK